MLKICLILSLALIQTNAFVTVDRWCNYDFDCRKPREYCFVDEKGKKYGNGDG